MNNKEDLQEFIDMFHEGKIYTYDDGETVWLTLDEYEYLRDFMSFFTNDELVCKKLKAHFISGDISFKLDAVMSLLGLDFDKIWLKINGLEMNNIECEYCGILLKYQEGSYYCNNKSCGQIGVEVDIECHNVLKAIDEIIEENKKLKNATKP